MLRFVHDHFGSFGSAGWGVNTPELQIADDDYAVGLVADEIAHSPYANNTLFVVIEDDPQDGADHVSGDRSVAFMVGPYVKQGGAVVSNPYTTVSVLRTIEEILGLAPLSIHDSGVGPMTAAFDTTQTCNAISGGGSSCWSYSASPASILFTTQLPLLNKYVVNRDNLPHPAHDAAWWAEKTKGMDFTQADRNDPEKFNRIIWEGVMGGKPYPNLHKNPAQAEKKGVEKDGDGDSE